jgi:hypothetical protein
MSQHIPKGVFIALKFSYGLAAARHLFSCGSCVSLAFTGIGVLGARKIKLREHGTRLAALKGRCADPAGAGRSPPIED